VNQSVRTAFAARERFWTTGGDIRLW
jgi:hypothetical protein